MGQSESSMMGCCGESRDGHTPQVSWIRRVSAGKSADASDVEWDEVPQLCGRRFVQSSPPPGEVHSEPSLVRRRQVEEARSGVRSQAIPPSPARNYYPQHGGPGYKYRDIDHAAPMKSSPSAIAQKAPFRSSVPIQQSPPPEMMTRTSVSPGGSASSPPVSRIADLDIASVSSWAVYHNEAIKLQRDGHAVEAMRMFEKAAEAQANFLGPEHPDLAVSVNSLGHIYRDMGRAEDARLCFRRCAQLYQKAYGPNDPRTMDAQRLLDST